MSTGAKQAPEKYCRHCGKRLERKRFNGRLEDLSAFSRRVYCNRKCMANGMEKEHVAHASTSREKANRTRKESCELCGAAGVKLHVHHVDSDPFNNSPSNLKTLCASCHRRCHSPNWEDDGKKPKPCHYCAAPSVKRGLCHTHLSRRWRFGHPLARKRKVGSQWVLMYERGGEWFSTLSAVEKQGAQPGSEPTAMRSSRRSRKSSSAPT